MASALMLLGTHSNAGKSVLSAAFCRILAREGVDVAPFKAQNMSNNAGVTPDGGEMGRAQIVQAEAAGIEPHTDMNPLLLKPEGGYRSHVVLNGRHVGHLDAANWRDRKQALWNEVRAAYDRLRARHDVIILEGAGSPAEINLKANDIVNLRMARHANAPCLLVGDIDRGGVFASLAGTALLLDEEERAQIAGFLINRFRGDPAHLGDGLEQLREAAFGIPTLGVVPWMDRLWVAEEDAVALERPLPPAPLAPDAVDIAVIRYPLISNFDEFDGLALEPGVRLRYVEHALSLGTPDAAILPGSKGTLRDLAWLRAVGFDRELARAAEGGTEIVGICGGLQMLGERIEDPDGLEGAPGESAPGLGRLGIRTTLTPRKTTQRRTYRLEDGTQVTGYEIHIGVSTLQGAAPIGARVGDPGAEEAVWSARSHAGNVWGTYLHDLFANDAFRHGWLARHGWDGPGISLRDVREREFDRLADTVKAAVDWPRIRRILDL